MSGGRYHCAYQHIGTLADELARRSGVGLSHLRKWARGIKGMSSDNLGRIMAALEIR